MTPRGQETHLPPCLLASGSLALPPSPDIWLLPPSLATAGWWVLNSLETSHSQNLRLREADLWSLESVKGPGQGPHEEDYGSRNPLPIWLPSPEAGHRAPRLRMREYKALLAQFQALGVSLGLSATPGICLAYLLCGPSGARESVLAASLPSTRPPSGAVLCGIPYSQTGRGPGPLRGSEGGIWAAASHSGPHRLPHRRENSPAIVCQPCWGKGWLHPWLGGFKGLTDLVAAVGQTVALVAWVAWVARMAWVALMARVALVAQVALVARMAWMARVAWVTLVARVTMAMEGMCLVHASYSGIPLSEKIPFQLQLHLLQGLQLLLVDVFGLQVA